MSSARGVVVSTTPSRVEIARSRPHGDGEPVSGLEVAQKVGVAFTGLQAPIDLLGAPRLVLRGRGARLDEQNAQQDDARTEKQGWQNSGFMAAPGLDGFKRVCSRQHR